MAATAALTVSPSSPATRSSGGPAREAMLLELEGDLVRLRLGLTTFVADPRDAGPRGRFAADLRKVAAGTTVLDWPIVAAALSRAEALVKSAGVLGSLDDDEQETLEAAVDRFADALHDDGDREPTPTSGPLRAASPGVTPGRQTQLLSVPVFVAGSRAIADTLRARGAAEGDGYVFAVRHLPRLDTAYAAVRAADPRPDVILVDGDEPGAEQLVEDLLGDSRTDAVPIVVVGTWSAPEHAARFVALGAARCLPKPLAAGELRRACAQVSPGVPSNRYEPLGRMTLDDLGARLASELHSSLCDSAIDDRMRRKLVDLGEGSAVLTVMWDAVARIRELVSAQSAGELRFAARRCEEALPAGVALVRSTSRDKSERSIGLDRRAESASLAAMTVLVAEDDLTTNWFLSGVLRDAGATVIDAFSAQEALDCARETPPDAVIAGLSVGTVGGVSLARAVREDVLLRDVPVIVLGADNAQVRRAEELDECGAGAILKGASSEVVLQRVREVTRARRSLAARLSDGVRIQGRLDDLAPTSLLRLVCQTTPNSRVTLHGGDAVVEVEVRDGKPVRACRTTADGNLRHGVDALAAVLALGAGRFLVEASEQPVVSELSGSLLEVLAGTVERVRGMQRAVSGAELLRIERVGFDAEALAGLVVMTPEPARTALAAMMSGRSPWSLVETGVASLNLVERVLVDVARRNAIVDLERGEGPSAVRSLPVLVDVTPVPGHVMPTAERVAHRVVAPSVELVRAAMAPLLPPPLPPLLAPPLPPLAFELARVFVPVASLTPSGPAPLEFGFETSTEAFDLPMADDPSWVSPVARVSTADVRHSSVGAEVVFEPVEDDELSPAAGPEPVITRPSSPSSPSRLTASTPPRARPSAPSVQPSFERPIRGAHTPILVSRLAVSQEALRRSTTPILTSAVREGQRTELASLDRPATPTRELAAPVPVVAAPVPVVAAPMPVVAAPMPVVAAPVPSAPSALAAQQEADAQEVPLPKSAMPSSYLPRSTIAVAPKPSSFRFVAPVVFAVVGVTLAVGARWWRYQEHAPQSAPVGVVQAPGLAELATSPEGVAVAATDAAARGANARTPRGAASVVDEPPATDVEVAKVASETPPAPVPAEPEEAPVESPLSAKERRKVDAEHGIVEIVAGRKDEIFVDGKRLGTGPTQRLALPAGGERHEIRVKMRGEERVRYVTAKAGVKLRFRIAPPWSH